MKRNQQVEILIGRGYFAVRIGNKVYGVVPNTNKLKHELAPVRQKSNHGKR